MRKLTGILLALLLVCLTRTAPLALAGDAAGAVETVDAPPEEAAEAT